MSNGLDCLTQSQEWKPCLSYFLERFLNEHHLVVLGSSPLAGAQTYRTQANYCFCSVKFNDYFIFSLYSYSYKPVFVVFMRTK